jgi:hypothetical protein
MWDREVVRYHPLSEVGRIAKDDGAIRPPDVAARIRANGETR